MPLDGTIYSNGPPRRSDHAAAVLESAAEMLARPGQWCKYASYVGGSKCLYYALVASAVDQKLDKLTKSRLISHVLQTASVMTGQRFRGIPDFNDDPNTTHTMVLAVLRQAQATVGLVNTGGYVGMGYTLRPFVEPAPPAQPKAGSIAAIIRLFKGESSHAVH